MSCVVYFQWYTQVYLCLMHSLNSTKRNKNHLKFLFTFIKTNWNAIMDNLNANPCREKSQIVFIMFKTLNWNMRQVFLEQDSMWCLKVLETSEVCFLCTDINLEMWYILIF